LIAVKDHCFADALTHDMLDRTSPYQLI